MKSYIPKTKDDINAINELQKYSFLEIQEDVKILLEWMQDMHWDVAIGIVKYFKNYIIEIEKEIIEILNSNDEEWKYNVLHFLIKDFQEKKLPKKLKEEIQRMAFSPNLSEIEEELDILSKEILQFTAGEQK